MEKIEEAAVLSDFLKAHPKPTPDAVMEAIEQWPDHAGAIRELAATLLEIEIRNGEGRPCPPTKLEMDEALRASSRSLLDEVRRNEQRRERDGL